MRRFHLSFVKCGLATPEIIEEITTYIDKMIMEEYHANGNRTDINLFSEKSGNLNHLLGLATAGEIIPDSWDDAKMESMTPRLEVLLNEKL